VLCWRCFRMMTALRSVDRSAIRDVQNRQLNPCESRLLFKVSTPPLLWRAPSGQGQPLPLPTHQKTLGYAQPVWSPVLDGPGWPAVGPAGRLLRGLLLAGRVLPLNRSGLDHFAVIRLVATGHEGLAAFPLNIRVPPLPVTRSQGDDHPLRLHGHYPAANNTKEKTGTLCRSSFDDRGPPMTYGAFHRWGRQ